MHHLMSCLTFLSVGLHPEALQSEPMEEVAWNYTCTWNAACKQLQ